MAQLFNWIRELFKPDKPKKRATRYPIIEFNQEKCRETLQECAMQLFNHSTESSVKILQRAIEAERNHQIMTIQSLKVLTPETLSRQQGRLDAFSHLLTFIEDALDSDQHAGRREKKGYHSERVRYINKGGFNSEPVL